jgi:Protein of unknown function (DUF2950)
MSRPGLTSLAFAMLLGVLSTGASAQQTFKTAAEAANALISAVRADDAKAIKAVLGPDGEDIISSGDPVADAQTKKDFLAAYDAKHQMQEDGGKALLIVGPEEYPVPLPIIRKASQWAFDTAAGRDEILFRRIGRNELDVIQTCLAYVDAQNEYAEKDHTGAGAGVYAQRAISQPGKRDGLYWPTSAGEEQSPLGPLLAEAARQGYRTSEKRAPFHGYYFKILTKQGPAAPGGALDYIVNANMIGGFALIAYPAEYRNSGVMTFIVSHAGVLYQKDLGVETTKVAERMTAFNPDSSWTKVTKTPP